MLELLIDLTITKGKSIGFNFLLALKIILRF